MEKIKDFFYYIGDFLICILILSAMYFLITWKLDETMPIEASDADTIAAKTDGSILEEGLKDDAKELSTKKDTEAKSDTKTNNQDNQKSQADDKSQSNQEDSQSVTTDNQLAEKDELEPNEVGEDNTAEQNQTSDQNTIPEENASSEENAASVDNSQDGSYNGGATSNAYVSFVISSGMSGQDIANNLQAQGVIVSATEFINKLEELDLSSSLLAGDFDLRQGMDYEEVIAILTGRN